MSVIYNLLSQTDRHPKMSKNGKVGVMSAVLHLMPANFSGYEVCPMRSPGCTKSCLNFAGHQRPRKYNARINKTKLFFENRPEFMRRLVKEVSNLEKRADRADLRPGVRLNGTSDIPWENLRVPGSTYNIMETFPNIMFMDYTKRPNRRDLPDNYKLVFSRSENNHHLCSLAIENGMNVAVVFANDLPEKFSFGEKTLPVIDGDEHDWRYGEYEIYDHRIVVGLRAKGHKARADNSGFVVRS